MRRAFIHIFLIFTTAMMLVIQPANSCCVIKKENKCCSATEKKCCDEAFQNASDYYLIKNSKLSFKSSDYGKELLPFPSQQVLPQTAYSVSSCCLSKYNIPIITKDRNILLRVLRI